LAAIRVPFRHIARARVRHHGAIRMAGNVAALTGLRSRSTVAAATALVSGPDIR
jgi:hypothetical protein